MFDSKIYVFSGFRHTKTERYDPQAGKWEKMEDMSTNIPFSTRSRIVPYANHFWAIYAEDEDELVEDDVDGFNLLMDICNPRSMKWSVSSKLKEANDDPNYRLVMDSFVFKNSP